MIAGRLHEGENGGGVFTLRSNGSVSAALKTDLVVRGTAGTIAAQRHPRLELRFDRSMGQWSTRSARMTRYWLFQAGHERGQGSKDESGQGAWSTANQ